jgi:phosphatidylglycerophosphate synthase
VKKIYSNLANFVTIVGIFTATWSIILTIQGATGLLNFSLIVATEATDFLDGIIARWLGIESLFGSILDRFRDKLFTCSQFFFMFATFWNIPSFFATTILSLLAIMVGIELCLFFAGLYGLAKKLPVEANRWGKRKMFLQCFIINWWALFYHLTPFNLEISNFSVLLSFVLVLSVGNYLAYKSISGYWEIYFNSSPA